MAGLARGVLDAALREGCDLGDVVRAFGVDLKLLDRSDAYVSVELHEALWAEAARRTGHLDFGVRAAEDFRPGLTGVIEYHLRSCASLGEIVAAWVRFAPVVSDRLSGALEAPPDAATSGGRAIFCWRLDLPLSEGTRHWAEFALGRALRMIRDAIAVDLTPREVWFRHAAPPDTTRHGALFRAPVRFGRREHALVFDARQLGLGVRGHDPVVRALLEDHADALRSERTDEVGVTERCRVAIRALLAEPTADASLGRVAERLGMSARTLQRRLRETGASFRELGDEVRETEATRLAERLSQPAIAERLGYGDASALRKAQRRWGLRDEPGER